MAKTLYQKVFEAHVVHEAAGETPIIYIDRHLVHEVTSPQAFDGLRKKGRKVRRTDRTWATMDHNVSTTTNDINASGEMARIQMQTLMKNAEDFGLTISWIFIQLSCASSWIFFRWNSEYQYLYGKRE